MKKHAKILALGIFSAVVFLLAASLLFPRNENDPKAPINLPDRTQIPEFSGKPYVVIEDNTPDFLPEELVTDSYESYSPLDALNRCGYAMACIGTDIMPTEERGSIGQVKPSGWQTVKYDHVDGKYLYNRCHLIGYQLTGENANPENLITGTRYCNVQGMLPFENMVADYVKETENHVLYRVTPVFEGQDLVARGIRMEALSVEDQGEGICFDVYVYNCQPGVKIDYATGDSELIPVEDSVSRQTYVLNTGSKRFHFEYCESVSAMKEKNKQTVTASREELLQQGYTPCGGCKP